MHLVVVDRGGDAVGCPVLPPEDRVGETVVEGDPSGRLTMT
jgi:hypothetical protein